MGCGFSSSLSAIYAILEQYMHIDHNIGSLVVSISAIIYSGIYEISEKLIDDKNTLFYICLNIMLISKALLILALIWSSKFFINRESFTLKTSKTCSQTEGSDYKFENENTSEYNDTFCSDGSYQPRDTSIVSI